MALADPPAASRVEQKRKVKPPQKVNAYPLLATNTADLQITAEQDACDFALGQAPRGNSLLILAFRRLHKKAEEFGVGADRPDSPFFSNEVDVRAALEAAGEGYEACRRQGRNVTIVYGNTNYKTSESGDDKNPMSTATASLAGAAQYQLASELNESSPSGVSYGIAGDIEPGFDPLGSPQAVALAEGASSQTLDYYDFGTAGQCPPLGECQGNWSLDAIAAVSQANRAQSLPEIYYPGQDQQWAQVRRLWDHSSACTFKRGRGHGFGRRPHCYAFYGATSQPPGCMGSQLAPWQSWTQLKQANPLNTVGRHLIYFNPDCLSKAGVAPKTGRDRTRRLPPGIPDRFVKASPGTLVRDPDPLVSSTVMPRIVNGWSVQSHRQITQVVAGRGRGRSGKRGLLVIARQRARPYSQTLDVVPVAGSGPLRITGAPAGKRGGQGSLNFAGARGVRGTLSLANDRLSLR